ncbi:MAG: hypothetical protein AAGG38_09640 [Planctomycetota bacterium]
MGGVNLIPLSRIRKQIQERRARTALRVWATYLGLLLLTTLGFLAKFTPPTADAAAEALALADHRAVLLQHKVSTAGQTLVEADRRLEGARVLAERPDWSQLLRLVAVAAGPDIVLSHFAVATNDATVDSGANVRIHGLASGPAAVSALALRLEDAELFDQVKILASRREPFRDRTANAFEIRCTLRGPDTPSTTP